MAEDTGMERPTYVVTGATGFLGKWLVRQLTENDRALVIALARGGDDELASWPGVQVLRASVTDLPSMKAALSDRLGIRGIYHLAGLVEHSWRRAEAMRRVHVDGTLNVLQLAVDLRIPRVVYASTSGTVACSTRFDPIGDDAEYASDVVGRWPYYHTKIQAEKAALAFAQLHPELQLVVLRPTLLLGPGDERRSSTTLVEEFIHRRIPLVPSGGLSFVDVRDAAIAFRAAMQKGASGRTYLLSAANVTHAQLYRQLEALTGIAAPTTRLPGFLVVALLRILYYVLWIFGVWIKEKDPVWAEMGNVYWSVDAGRAARELDFKPRDPTETLRTTVEWIYSNQTAKKIR